MLPLALFYVDWFSSLIIFNSLGSAICRVILRQKPARFLRLKFTLHFDRIKLLFSFEFPECFTYKQELFVFYFQVVSFVVLSKLKKTITLIASDMVMCITIYLL